MTNGRDEANRIQAARELREALLNDRHRPGYHFATPEDIGRPGDPNGAFFANGRYHLMYLYDRRGVSAWKGKGFCWGHVSSSDLVHWRHHADALSPGNGDGGCFSGGAFLDDDGTAYITYWSLPLEDGNVDSSGIGIAQSRSAHYDEWEKLQVPSLNATEFGIQQTGGDADKSHLLCNADPSNIWKVDDTYFMLAGNLPLLNKLGRNADAPVEYRGDWADLFESTDMLHWRHVHRFYQRAGDNSWTLDDEDHMCPSFLPLPLSSEGGPMSDRHLLLFISHNRGCQYYIGAYQAATGVFQPESHGRMTWMDNTYFAPEALVDPSGRQIMWAWLVDNLHSELEDEIRDGWSGVYGLPRVLWLGDDNTLRMAPVPELETLRYNAITYDDIVLEANGELQLEGINGESCNIEVTVTPNSAQKAGVGVRTSPNQEETTLLYYDAAKSRLVFDSSRSGDGGRKVVEEAPFALAEGEALNLKIFVDKSVVEVFANDRQAIARRVYPARDDSTQVRLFCSGDEATFAGVSAWEMMPSNPW